MSEFPYSIDMFGISMTNIFIPITYFVRYYGLIFSHEKCTFSHVNHNFETWESAIF